MKSIEEFIVLVQDEVNQYHFPKQPEGLYEPLDYFLKIVGDYKPEYIQQTIDRIKSIQQVVTSYSIDVNKLKSKEFLIF